MTSDPFTTSMLVSPAIASPPVELPAIAPGRKLRAQSSAAATGYNGGRMLEQNRDWLTAHYSGDSAIATGWDNVTQRARDLVRNEPWAAQAKLRIPQNVVGAEGIQAESEIENADGSPDDEARAEIDTWCNRWADGEADAEGELDLDEIQYLAMSEVPEVGEVFLVEVSDPDPQRIIPLCYQVFEAEQINTDLDRFQRGDTRIKRGIEFDKFGRRVAYHFWTEHPYDMLVSATDTVRVPASRVIHYYEKRRPSQTRGITWFAPILQTLRDMSKYIGTEMAAAEFGARFAVAIKRAAGAGSGLGFGDGTATGSDSAGNSLEYLGFPIIGDLAAEDAIEQIQANRPNAAAEPWIKLILHSMANGIGLTYLGLTGDTAGASFSSARFAQNKDKVFYRTIQGRFGRRVPLPIRCRAIEQLVAMRRVQITPTQFRANRHHWLATRLLPPGWEEIQPVEEVNAAIARIQAGISTLQEECAGRRKNWRSILRQRARELTLVKSLELDLTTNYPGRVSVSEAAAVPGEEPAADQRGGNNAGN